MPARIVAGEALTKNAAVLSLNFMLIRNWFAARKTTLIENAITATIFNDGENTTPAAMKKGAINSIGAMILENELLFPRVFTRAANKCEVANPE